MRAKDTDSDTKGTGETLQFQSALKRPRDEREVRRDKKIEDIKTKSWSL